MGNDEKGNGNEKPNPKSEEENVPEETYNKHQEVELSKERTFLKSKRYRDEPKAPTEKEDDIKNVDLLKMSSTQIVKRKGVLKKEIETRQKMIKVMEIYEKAKKELEDKFKEALSKANEDSDIDENKLSNTMKEEMGKYWKENKKTLFPIYNSLNPETKTFINNKVDELKKTYIQPKKINNDIDIHKTYCEVTNYTFKIISEKLEFRVKRGTKEECFEIELQNDGQQLWPKDKTALLFDPQSSNLNINQTPKITNSEDVKPNCTCKFKILLKNLEKVKTGDYTIGLNFNVDGKNYGSKIIIKLKFYEPISKSLIDAFRNNYSIEDKITDDEIANNLEKYKTFEESYNNLPGISKSVN